VFKALCLLFLSNFPGPTLIPCPTSITDSRVDIFDFVIYQKFKKGTLIKCLISMLPNLAQALQSSAKLKNKQIHSQIVRSLTQKKILCNMHFHEIF
jgi:hypothetical protein